MASWQPLPIPGFCWFLYKITFCHQVSGDTAKSLDSRLESRSFCRDSHMDRGLGRCVVCVLPASEASTPPKLKTAGSPEVMIRIQVRNLQGSRDWFSGSSR